MDDQQLVRAVITFVVVGFLVPATLWYFGIRFAKPQLKGFGVVIGVTYLLLAGYNIGQELFDWFPNVYTTYMDGPGQRTRGDSVAADGTYRVNVAGSRHQVVLTPVAVYGEPATVPVTIAFEVQTPSGQVVAKGMETLAPGKPYWTPLRTDKAAKWTPMKVEFTSPEEGEHKLILQIPKPVRKVRVEIAERKK
jgi:hypothetical protein